MKSAAVEKKLTLQMQSLMKALKDRLRSCYFSRYYNDERFLTFYYGKC